MVRFFRIVRTDPPTADDFTSDAARGRPTHGDGLDAVRLASGLSVYATLTQARAKARAYRFLGSHVAVIDLQDDGPIRWERTLPRSRGHHTVWGAPEDLLLTIVAIVPL